MSGERPRALVDAAARRLAAAGVVSARGDALVLLAHVLGIERGEAAALLVLDRALPGGVEGDGAAAAFEALVVRRERREPLQHLTGVAPFRHVELVVGPGVFVPRPETEQVAQVAIDEARRVAAEHGSVVVADLCTGSGAIALAVATEVAGARVYAVELDAAAFGWAARNLEGSGVVLVKGDARTALCELDGAVDVVVSNPPYVPTDAVPRDPEVAVHDPAVALYGLGKDGLEVPRGVTAAAARLLRDGGLYVMEHAEVQGAAARAMVDAVDAFERAVTREDLTGRPRMVTARRRRGPVEH